MLTQLEFEIMTAQGHDTIKYDPDDPEDVNRVKQEIKGYLEKGYKLALGKEGQHDNLEFIKNVDDLDKNDYDRVFLLSGHRKLLTQPNAGG